MLKTRKPSRSPPLLSVATCCVTGRVKAIDGGAAAGTGTGTGAGAGADAGAGAAVSAKGVDRISQQLKDEVIGDHMLENSDGPAPTCLVDVLQEGWQQPNVFTVIATWKITRILSRAKSSVTGIAVWCATSNERVSWLSITARMDRR